ncbi:hypothetical protein [Paenibacillus sp. W2I17]|uniref:hypothetical protein n=1 Tax=Paenibacillus sp. W2I17 TaxID=3042311 RepID=UPI002789E210|nr:hypothetical protein [Paenibacillus sp. W2I17]MDQ0660601.1 hypothetical protein [Paenibacillus sp. W2I17]
MQELIEKLKADKLAYQAELTNRKMMWLNEEEKLKDLKERVKQLTLTHAPVEELDVVYEEINKQEVIVNRRKNEYELISENSVFEFSLPMDEIMRQAKNYEDQEKAICDSILEEVLQKKQEYLDLIGKLEDRVYDMHKQKKAMNIQLNHVNGSVLQLPDLWSMYNQKASFKTLTIPVLPIKHREVW